MKILIRADGGLGIGMGHIMRTIVLAKELSKEHKVTYVSLDKSEYSKGFEFIIDNNIELIKINNEDEIYSIDGDMIIVDKYAINESYLEKLNDKYITIYIDDNKNLKSYPCNMVINHNPHGIKLNYNCKALQGSRYTIIRDEFRDEEKLIINKKVKNILITLGGSDDKNITKDLIESLVSRNYNLHIVIGPAYIYKDELMKYKSDRIFLYTNAKMSELMKMVDLAISACGTTLYELAYLGIPTLGLILYDNQKLCGEYMASENAIILGDINRIDFQIENLEYNERLRLHNNMIKLIDGNGVYRIKEEIEKFENRI